MKKLIIFLVCSAVLFTGTAFAEPYRVFDNADILTAEEEAQIEEMIRDFQMDVGLDFAVLTTSDENNHEQGMQIAEAFYEEHGFGMGRNKSGAVYYIDTANGYTNFFTAGDINYYMPDYRKSIANEIVIPDLSDGKYAFGIMLMMTVIKAFVYDGPRSVSPDAK